MYPRSYPSEPRIPNPKFRILSAAADEVHHFNLIAFRDERAVERAAPQHDEIVLDRNAAAIDVELTQQVGDRHRTGQLESIAVERDDHGDPAPRSVRRRCSGA